MIFTLKNGLLFQAFRYILIGFLLNTSAIFAQNSGEISGTCISQKVALEFVKVLVYSKNDSTKLIVGATTDTLGNFNFKQLILDTYLLKFKLNGFIPSLGLGGIKEKLENEIRPDDVKNGKCTKPTVDNPFMNVTMKDYMNFDENGFVVNRPPACDPNDPEVKKMMDETFSNNLYRDVSDVFGKKNSQRNYFTMPWTTIPNKQDEFARWLYLSPKTCKEDQDYCLRYEDIRSKRFVMPNPERNPVSSKKDTPV